jgi:hypothetical protein
MKKAAASATRTKPPRTAPTITPGDVDRDLDRSVSVVGGLVVEPAPKVEAGTVVGRLVEEPAPEVEAGTVVGESPFRR